MSSILEASWSDLLISIDLSGHYLYSLTVSYSVQSISFKNEKTQPNISGKRGLQAKWNKRFLER